MLRGFDHDRVARKQGRKDRPIQTGDGEVPRSDDPDHPARPSQFDTDHAWVDYVYIIVNTTADGAGDLNGFTLAEEGGPFRQLPLMVTPGPGPAR